MPATPSVEYLKGKKPNLYVFTLYTVDICTASQIVPVSSE